MCGIATLAFAGRGLGVLLFGTLILITSYAKAVSGIAKFQSWQLIVRYGGHGVAHGDPEHFKVATGFAFALDVVSGIGGMLVGAALLPFIGQLGRHQPPISVARRCSTARCCRPWARRRPTASCACSTAST